MNRRLAAFIASFLICINTHALAISTEDVLRQSRELAAEKKYTKALVLLKEAEAAHPKDSDIKIAIASVQSWQGHYKEAEQILDSLGKKENSAPDVLLLRANLAYYKHDFSTAAKLYQRILAKHPDYKDAKEGLLHAENAIINPVPPHEVATVSVEDALIKSRKLAAEQKYSDALVLLQKTTETHPNDIELKLSIVRVMCWQGNFQDAENVLNNLDEKHNTNPGVIILHANLAYYKHDYVSAIALYKKILAEHPDYEDAKTGLADAEKALNSPENQHYRWQADAGYEHSSFSRVDMPRWNQEFTQITHFLDDNQTAIHARITRYDQFSNIDSEFEAGINHRFFDYLSAYAFSDVAPEATFRPNYAFASGGAIRIIKPGKIALPPVWLTIDSNYNLYSSNYVAGVNTGLSIGLWDGWSVAGKIVATQPEASKRIYGKSIRLDGIITSKWRFHVGYSNAPDTENGITVNTKTYYGGIATDITPQVTLRVDYAHDNRQDSYIRQGISTSVSYRF